MPAPDARTRTRRLAVGIVLALMLAACGGATTSEGGVSFPSPAPSAAEDGDAGVTDGAATEPVPAESIDPVAPSLDPDTSVSSSPHAPSPGPGGGPDVTYEETPIVPTEGTPRPVAFESTESSPEDTEVIVRWWSGVPPCTALADVEVVEDDTTVTITVYEASEHPDDADVACIAIAQAKQHTVQLDAPLGDREIVDGAA